MTIGTLVVEDELVAGEAHLEYVERVPGFTPVGLARSGRDALTALRERQVDLVLLDFHLPDGHGLDVVRRMRAAGHAADVLAVTAERDVAEVRRAVTLGVVGYLLKPFSVATFTAKLENYAQFHARSTSDVATQHDVDSLLGTLTTRPPLPVGLTSETLAIVRALVPTGTSASAAEIAAQAGIGRVTARRYLEHLTDIAAVTREPRYGGSGRPTMGYRRTS